MMRVSDTERMLSASAVDGLDRPFCAFGMMGTSQLLLLWVSLCPISGTTTFRGKTPMSLLLTMMQGLAFLVSAPFVGLRSTRYISLVFMQLFFEIDQFQYLRVGTVLIDHHQGLLTKLFALFPGHIFSDGRLIDRVHGDMERLFELRYLFFEQPRQKKRHLLNAVFFLGRYHNKTPARFAIL